MNILITGGSGLIGRALIGLLMLDGHGISVLTRNAEKSKAKLPPEVLLLKWDGISSNGWGQLIEETDAVINLAGESIAGESFPAILTRHWTEKQKNRIKQSRLNIGQALTDAIRSASKKPSVLIQASAVGYYGPHGVKPIPEDTPPGNDFLAEVCQIWESSTAEIEKLGVRRAIIRTGLVLAPDGGILPIMLMPFHFFFGGPIGNGRQYIPWIHIQDQVNAIRHLLNNKNEQGAFNLSAPFPVNNAEFGRIVGQVLKRPSWFPVPSIALKLILGEKAALVLEGQRAIPERLLESGYQFNFDSLETALRNLNTR